MTLPAPAPPTAVQATPTPDGTGVQLTWTASTSSVTGYRIYRDGDVLSAAYDTATASPYTDSLLGGAAHQYYVAAINSQNAESPRVQAVSP
jgi:hypothetical protein